MAAEEQREYDPHDYPPVAATVDIVALTIRGDVPHVLLVRRGEAPYRNSWALPGGFVRPDEDLATAALRELSEETHLTVAPHLEQLGTYGTPDRDPRMRVISVAHLAIAAGLPEPKSGSDAADAQWVPLSRLGFGDGAETLPLAFDHAVILADAVERARAKLEYTPIATSFLPPEFTIAQLRAIYESLWNEPLHAANFHRKVRSVSGFVIDTGHIAPSGRDKGGRRARLYRAGEATLLHPALLRPSITSTTA
ncbi:8-oxo-dGTP diphosphatase [Stackebrandtia endophytica]|uniref:8-oxo-dGTP diphosphatase n=1 Tax=Stackebrandtia endophytica TaxID=1496996 RepID=A0A543B3F1_9ACTN|nr:NUDIX domain-containing protein [Stackebrandtia endophytica]TQL79371.1 8-oxo-dGTP diphosphatase [Stackebrandtia endophytica]